jgi:phosphoglycolate phosphatase
MPMLNSSINPQLIIFDKDGTLIDFDAMWGGWVGELAQRLEAATNRELSGALFELMDYDPVNGRIDPHGRLAIAPMSVLWDETLTLLTSLGLAPAAAESRLRTAWQPPDPAQLAFPLADLPALFTALRRRGLKIAIATSDDRQPTIATLAALGVQHLVDAIAAADDGIATKPDPAMVLSLCRQLGIEPGQAIVVGDTVADLRMGRAAGAGLVVGVLSGVSGMDILAPQADLILNSVEEIAGINLTR